MNKKIKRYASVTNGLVATIYKVGENRYRLECRDANADETAFVFYANTLAPLTLKARAWVYSEPEDPHGHITAIL